MPGNKKIYLAIDIGASSGRVTAGIFDGKRLCMETVHRFSTLPVEIEGSLRLDLEAFVSGIREGIARAYERYGKAVSAGVCSWGGQPLAINADGDLLEAAYYYRDPHFNNLESDVFNRMPAWDLYRITGMYESSIPKLMAHMTGRSPSLDQAEKVFSVADYLTYRLSGVRVHEYTQARITQLLDARTGTWSDEILTKMDIPRRLFGEVVYPSQKLGFIKEDFFSGSGDKTSVTAIGAHDTASAFAAAPVKEKTAAFISLGTWAILGCESEKPVINAKAFASGFQNNAVAAGPVALVKNLEGLWLLEECRRSWRAEGRTYTFSELVDSAGYAKPFTAILDTIAQGFFAPGDMPRRVIRACLQTGDTVPEVPGEITRTILEGLALCYRHVLTQLADTVEREFSSLHVFGGGSRNELLIQFIADACGLPVTAGPHEATSAGSIMAQMTADNEITSLKEGRELISRSFPLKTFTPADRSSWDDAYTRLQYLQNIG